MYKIEQRSNVNRYIDYAVYGRGKEQLFGSVGTYDEAEVQSDRDDQWKLETNSV